MHEEFIKKEEAEIEEMRAYRTALERDIQVMMEYHRLAKEVKEAYKKQMEIEEKLNREAASLMVAAELVQFLVAIANEPEETESEL